MLAQIFDEVRNIVAAIAQRRKRDADHVDAIEKIGAKSAGLDFLLQIAIGRADHARVHALFFMVADAREMAVLQNVQQLRLQAPVELGDFVQEQRAALRHFHAAGFCGVRARESAFLESKQFAFEQRAGNRRAIHFHERAFPPGRALVNETRQHFLASAAFTEDQNREHSSRAARDTFCRTACMASEGPK